MLDTESFLTQQIQQQLNRTLLYGDDVYVCMYVMNLFIIHEDRLHENGNNFSFIQTLQSQNKRMGV